MLMEKRYGITGSVSGNYKWTGNITDRILSARQRQ